MTERKSVSEEELSRRKFLLAAATGLAGGGLALASAARLTKNIIGASIAADLASQEKFPLPPSEELVAAQQVKAASDQKIIASVEQGDFQAASSEAQSAERQKAMLVVTNIQNHQAFAGKIARQLDQKNKPENRLSSSGFIAGIIGMVAAAVAETSKKLNQQIKTEPGCYPTNES